MKRGEHMTGLIVLVIAVLLMGMTTILAIVGMVGIAIKKAAEFMDDSFFWGGGRDI